MSESVHTHAARGASGGFGIEMPDGQMCDLCQLRPGQPHRCPGDHRQHGHGMMHRVDNGRLYWTCCECADVLASEWQSARAGN